MNYDMIRCGERIQQLRTGKGYTQDDLAAELNINRSFVSRIETGEKGCSIDTFIQLSEIFHVSLDFLILGKLDMTWETKCKEQLRSEITNLVDLLITFQKQI